MTKVRMSIDQIKRELGTDLFSFFYTIDSPVRGQFDAVVYKNQKDSCEGDGLLVWSKAELGLYPVQDWTSFIARVRQAIEE